MSNVTPISSASNEKRLDEASHWIAKIDRELSESEKTEFQKWMNANESNQNMLIQMAKMWDKMDALERLGGLFPHTPNVRSFNLKRYVAVAASFFLVCALSFSAWQGGMFSDGQLVAQQVVSKNTYTTGIGEQSTFFLQDKTKVELNTNSEVRVTYTDKQRVFELYRGEMHVTVAHNVERPLSVYAGGKIIQAVGTAFNVEVKEGQVELLVTDGKVLVTEQSIDKANPLQLATVRLPHDSMAISKGQIVELGSVSEKISILKPADIEANLSWQRGSLVFRGESLEAVLLEVSRYTHYEFEFANEEIKKLQVAGLFKTDDIEALLDALFLNFDIQRERTGSKKIQLSRAHVVTNA